MSRDAARDARFMARALEEARRAEWATHPNPMVGAVLVRGEEVLSTGYHHAAGEDHAEVVALKELDMKAPGAEIFVTLEPCNHHARTPPCTQALISAGIRRCVIGSMDPDPRVSGRGIEALRAAGMEVSVGVLEEECRAVNAPFFKRVMEGLPFVTLKMAMSLDGRVATRTGHSQWISGPGARRMVHEMRARHDAVLVGTGTLLYDDPRLTVRDAPLKGVAPVRVVLDRCLRSSPTRQIFLAPGGPLTWLVTSLERVEEAQKKYPGHVEIIGVEEEGEGLSLRGVLVALSEREVTTVLCEGGATLAGALVEGGLVDELALFVAPRLIGGASAPGPLGGLGVERVNLGREVDFLEVRRVAPDLFLRARVR